jgi:hypothetical protein
MRQPPVKRQPGVNGIDILISDDVERYAEATTLNIF